MIAVIARSMLNRIPEDWHLYFLGLVVLCAFTASREKAYCIALVVVTLLAFFRSATSCQLATGRLIAVLAWLVSCDLVSCSLYSKVALGIGWLTLPDFLGVAKTALARVRSSSDSLIVSSIVIAVSFVALWLRTRSMQSPGRIREFLKLLVLGFAMLIPVLFSASLIFRPAVVFEYTRRGHRFDVALWMIEPLTLFFCVSALVVGACVGFGILHLWVRQSEKGW